MNEIKHLSVEERAALGKAARERTRLSDHSGWAPAADRPDPVALLEEQNATREADLVPVRHGRMMVSPFTFYRGAAKIMAADLKDTPTAGLNVQLCGDAHLSNFGVFASPERSLGVRRQRLRRDAAGPVRVRREADGGELHDRGTQQRLHRPAGARRDACAPLRRIGRRWPGSRRCARWTSGTRTCPKQDLMAALDGHDQLRRRARTRRRRRPRRRTPGRTRQKARTRDSLQALSKLAEQVDGQYRIVSQPPVVVPARDLAPTIGMSADELADTIHEQFRAYRGDAAGRSPSPARTIRSRRCRPQGRGCRQRRHPGVHRACCRAAINRTRCSCRSKEATASVLEDHLPKSRYHQPGERVVQGQRMMQAASDIYLGWTKGAAGEPVPLLATAARHEGLRGRRGDGADHPLDVRTVLRRDAGAGARPIRRPDRASRRTSAPRTSSTSRSPTSPQRYADQNEQDYRAFCDAIRSGRLEAIEGV